MSSRDTILVSRTLYQIGVITLISSVVWVLVGIYSVSKQEINVEVDKQILAPLTVEMDQEVVSSLSTRLKITGVIPSSTPSAVTIQEVAPSIVVEEEVLPESEVEEIISP